MEDRYHGEILRTEVCKRYVQRDEGVGSSDTAYRTMIDLNIGDFCDHIDESFAVEIANDPVPLVRLVIDSAEDIRPEVVGFLAKYIAPKIIEISVINCRKLSWKSHLKPIMECVRSVEIINLEKNKWVDDQVIDQITLKFTKCLRELNLENTTVSDHALSFIGKRCPNLRKLMLMCCPKVSDKGLAQMVRKIHLSSLHISHNLLVTDVGIEKLISASSQLTSIELQNCPNITDKSIEAMYEGITAWGKRRNTKSASLKKLVLRDCHQITYQSLIFISTAVPGLKVLDLRDCLDIDLTHGLKQLEGLKSIEELYLGPTDYPVEPLEILQSILFHAANLKVLHMIELHGMEDDHVAEILDGTLVLEELRMEGMEVGIHTVESLCSSVPNLKQLHIVGSKFLQDADVRCVSAVCLRLEQLTLSKCLKLTDAAFSRCSQLMKLGKLNLAQCSKLLDGSFLGSFTLCPLVYLNLDGISLPKTTSFTKELAKLSTMTSNSVQDLSMQNISQLDNEDVNMALRTFWNCRNIDITGSGKRFPASLMSPGMYKHPFLSLKSTHEFIGYSEEGSGRIRHSLFQHRMTHLKNHRLARGIQTCRRQYVDRMKELARLAKVNLARHKNNMAAIIQGLARGVVTRALFRVKLEAGRRIVRGARRWFKWRMHTKLRWAKRYYVRELKRRLFQLLHNYTQWSIDQFGNRLNKLYPKMYRRVKRNTFLLMVDTEERLRDERLYAQAIVLWEGHFLRKVMWHWKQVRGETLVLQKQLRDQFMLIAQEPTHNNARQSVMRSIADAFYRNKILVISWVCINDDFIRARRAELLVPMAQNHWDNSFFERVVRGSFTDGIVHYVLSKRIKNAALKKAPKIRKAWLRFNGLRYAYEERMRRKRAREAHKAAIHYNVTYGKRMAVCDRFIVNVYHSLFHKRLDLVQYDHWCQYKTRYYYKEMLKNLVLMKILRKLEWKAEQRYRDTYQKRYWGGWIEHYSAEKNIMETTYHDYLLRWAAKCFNSLKQELEAGRAYLAHLEAQFEAAEERRNAEEKKDSEEAGEAPAQEEDEEGEQQEEEEEEEEELTEEEKEARAKEKEEKEAAEAAERQRLAEEERLRKEEMKRQALIDLKRRVTLFQACVRGGFARTWWTDRQTDVYSAIQVLQNNFRRVLARLLRRRLERARDLSLFLSQERETNDMWRADQFSQLFRTCFNDALFIQRVYRGWRGRVHGAIQAYEISRAKNRDFYEAGEVFRANLEAMRRELERLQKKRYEGAQLIQKRVRGMLARIAFVKVKAQAKKVALTIAVQRDYRKRLGELKLLAMRRDKEAEIRYRAARAQRGMLLRAFGFRKRKQQAILGVALDALGVDPMSYNYRFKELVYETIDDMYKTWAIFKRELGIAQQDGLTDTNARVRTRRNILSEQHVDLRVLDPCRIMDPNHPYVGCTGLVVRVDKSIPGTPLFEVKLDGHNGRQTFVHMTTDPLQVYMNVQPLAKIPVKPKLRDFHQPFLLFGQNEGDPMFTFRNIHAAWTIQRAFRLYRSKKIVARRRYEFWLRSGDMQWNFFTHLAETNTLTMQANNILYYLGVRPHKPVTYEEVRHPLVSERFLSSVAAKNEKKNLKEEFAAKYRERLMYLQKSAVIEGKEYFATGFEKITTGYKLRLAYRRNFGVKKKKRGHGSHSGHKTIKAMQGKHALVEGLDVYDFQQFYDSPHIRYYKRYLYQGQWSGIPLFTQLKPHGEGMLIFFDGWGFAREEKVVYIELIACRHLNAADLDTSDPYAKITCNGTLLTSSVKWRNLNPVYNEKFEIDVTNTSAKLNIAMFDYDYIGSDDFLGQIELRLGDFADGKEKHETYQLRGEDITADEDFDRGEIELRVRWATRKFEQDLLMEELRERKAIKIQTWARRIASIGVVIKRRQKKEALLKLVRRRSVQITNTCRICIAKKKLRRLRARKLACIKIQKRARVRIARQEVKYRRTRWKAAIKIQAIMRGFLASAIVKRVKRERKERIDQVVTIIQKSIRRKLARMRVSNLSQERKLRLEAEEAEKEDNDFDAEEEEGPTVAEWLKTYGVDPEYGLRRNRRMTDTYFQRIIRMPFIRLVSKYGVVYADEYPAMKSDEDMLAEKAGEEPLTNREDFVGVYFPQFDVRGTHRAKAISIFNDTPHFATIHLPTAINMRQTVNFNVVTIQCAARIKMALNAKKQILKYHEAFRKFQRIFKRRNEVQQKAAMLITALFHLIHAKHRVNVTRAELRGSTTIQCAFRCYRARCKIFDKRCVRALSVLKYSSAIPFHGPAKALEFRMVNFWMSDSPNLAEIRVEMRKIECITEIWIMTSTLKCCPRFVSISFVADKKAKSYVPLVERSEMKETRGPRWHKYAIGESLAKYYKITFEDNYGDDTHIGIRQIRFMRATEKSPTILSQPDHHIMENGPTVGRIREVTLHCPAEAWPRPTYQWYRNGRLVPGATEKDLKLCVKCPLDHKKRSFRCLKCKMFSRNIPDNAYRVCCRNCNAIFVFKEFKPYMNLIEEFREEEISLREEMKKLTENKEQMMGMADFDTNNRLKMLLQDINDRIKVAEIRLQELKEARFSAKSDLEGTNAFHDEGIYYCIVTNIRGGSIQVMRKSRRAVVVVEHSEPYAATVKPYYRPRKQEVRKKWTTYQSIFGTFVKGMLKGIVTIRYADGSFYEGPYIGEEWLDAAGVVIEEGRAYNHYGIFQCADGRVFEGRMIDNHFDPNNLQSFYRLTTAQGEQYEGMFCDEHYHGTGVYKFADGSTYEGHWHRGTRFGHGHLRSSEGWTYEGGFNTNTRHGYGCIDYPDGSMYLGQWYYDKKEGRGVIISELRDIYKGDVVNGIKEGFGEMLYADGSRHVGIFKGNHRNGKGIFRDSDGTEYYGTFIEDRQHGEHVMKFMIPIEEEGQDNFEIRIGVFDMGEFKKWKLKYANPQVTKQFVKLFTEDTAMFDSVYSMVVAKNLPNVPEGVDRNDPEVKEILKRIRNDAGGLVGQGAKLAAQKQMDELLVPLKATRADIERITDEIDEIALTSIAVDKEAAELMRKYGYLMGEVDKGLDRIEQYWIDEPSESRNRFKLACEQLNTVAMNEYFTFRNYRIPPPFTKKIMDCVSILLGITKDWKDQQLIISNSVVNGREGDDLGLRFDFDCKLAYLMKDYNVYQYTRLSEGDVDLASILCDPRLRRDSYYVESCGPAGPAIVDWIKTNVLYLEKSRTVVDQTLSLEEKRAEAFRLRVLSQKKREEFGAMQQEMDSLKAELTKKKGELMDLDEALAKVAEMLDFITANDLKQEVVKKEDYYLEMEQKIEEKKDHFIVETCVMFLVGEVEERRDLERQVKIREALARGEVYSEDETQHPKIKDWLMKEVRSEQKRVIEKEGRTLGYSILPDDTALSWDETQFIIDMIVLRVVGKLNEAYNDFASALMWHTKDGKSFDSRFMYILAWKYWEAEGEEAKEIKACLAWEETFAEGVEQRARMSIEAKVNHRMSEEAQEQGRIWGKRHKVDVLKAEQILSEQFEYDFPVDQAKNAFDISNDETGTIPPATKALAISWARLHPEEMNEAKDEHNQELAEAYAKQTGDKAGYTAVKIFNGFATEDEMAWETYAEQWKSYNNEEYLIAQAKLIDENAAAFVEEYPNFSAQEAASIIENDTLSRLVLDEEVQEELTVTPEAYTNAKCWGLRNVGLLRAATAQLNAKNEGRLKTLWIELETATEGWKKGSFLLLPPAAQENPDLDRFSGFRARLENKYAWVYGFLSKLHIDLFAELETFPSKDPMGKVIHGIRPSTFEKYQRNIEESFLKHKKLVESKLTDTIAKISTWNSYFGVKEEEEDVEGGGQIEQQSSQATS